jgi:hypothetical protein
MPRSPRESPLQASLLRSHDCKSPCKQIPGSQTPRHTTRAGLANEPLRAAGPGCPVALSQCAARRVRVRTSLVGASVHALSLNTSTPRNLHTYIITRGLYNPVGEPRPIHEAYVREHGTRPRLGSFRDSRWRAPGGPQGEAVARARAYIRRRAQGSAGHYLQIPWRCEPQGNINTDRRTW